ncbi:Outer membrane lipoprotein Blc [Pedobacter sp. Bi126]|nr:Outer membrane lipoprotein Blc [Pedobacter sp. Bi126]
MIPLNKLYDNSFVPFQKNLKMNKRYPILFLALGVGVIAINLISCVSIPKGATAVKPFKKDKYLGKWYEIARMDFKFEKDLNNVTATYSLKDDGSIKVDNRGYNYVKKEWKQSIGKAKFVNESNEGRLKVSFFGPFYAGYNVIEVDSDYQYALVAGNNLKYLWILSRNKSIPENIKQQYLRKAESLGYDTATLVWTKQD